MDKREPVADPQAYVASLDGWPRACVERLRRAVRTVPTLEESVTWGHLVYSSNGPVLLIRAEAERVLFGFWRGQRLRAIEPRLKPGGKYEMATLVLHDDTALTEAAARRLAEAATALNHKLGDPRMAARRARHEKLSRPR